jgi:hypothetical protein
MQVTTITTTVHHAPAPTVNTPVNPNTVAPSPAVITPPSFPTTVITVPKPGATTPAQPTVATVPAGIGNGPTSPYSLVKSYSGNEFFTDFSFFTGSDPTNGFVE